jgi:Fur family iron response transcriptional regulator
MLERVGLRPSRQRIALAQMLFAEGHRHVTADMLYAEALLAKLRISRATVYNTLHQFTEAGLVRRVTIDASKSYFDTNVSEHHHFFLEDVSEIVDISADDLTVRQMPAVPGGYEVDRLDILVRLKRS